MRLHLDTSFLIDWYANLDGALEIGREIRDGLHEISIDTIVETEYFAAQQLSVDQITHFFSVVALGTVLAPNSASARLAASWLAPMDQRQRRAHFADALIGATSTIMDARLVTGDHLAARIPPIDAITYRRS